MKNIELNKLVAELGKAEIPFEIYPYHMMEQDYFQVCYPNKQNCIIDAVSTPYTYGGKDGLIEIMWESRWEADDVLGWLTAEETFPYFLEAFVKNNNVGD